MVEQVTFEQSALSTRNIGIVKWFNSSSGFGFITVLSGDSEFVGKDIFVHYSNLRTKESQYKYLVMGEYVDFAVTKAHNEKYEYFAEDISGILGGNIMCETRRIANEDKKEYDERSEQVRPQGQQDRQQGQQDRPQGQQDRQQDRQQGQQDRPRPQRPYQGRSQQDRPQGQHDRPQGQRDRPQDRQQRPPRQPQQDRPQQPPKSKKTKPVVDADGFMTV